MIGQTISHYEILEKLGEGGMGVVYKARDTSLERWVAVKTLLPGQHTTPEQRRRFIQEARAASSLNHPNIVGIYEIDSYEGTDFIVMEWVDGAPLDRIMPASGMPLRQALKYAVQVADALNRSHAAGIIHRDLKPSNLLVARDGTVKVADFGLAKLTQQSDSDPAAETATFKHASALTEQGAILGTVAYMSPEQAEGKPLGPASDIFSFGAVLYEMITGRRAFAGGTRLSTLAAILTRDPQPVAEIVNDVPPQLERMVARCLRKDPERRIQHMGDIRLELAELIEEADSTRAMAQPGTAASGRRRRRIAAAVIAPALLLLSASAGFFLAHRLAPQAERWKNAFFTQLTDEQGEEVFPSMAPDGNSFVYAGRKSGPWHIYFRRTGGRNAIDLTPDSKVDNTQPAYSPDGQSIAFRSNRDGGGIFLMGATGENVRRLTKFGFNPAWSPDGAFVACVDWPTLRPEYRGNIHSRLWVVPASPAQPRVLDVADAVSPSWSPHAIRIAYAAVVEGRGSGIWTADARPGKPAQPMEVVLGSPVVWNPVWAPDGWLYFSSNSSGPMGVWRVRVDEESGRVSGAPEPVPTPSAYSGHMSFSRDGRRMLYAQMHPAAVIETLDFDPVAGRLLGPAKPLSQRPLAGVNPHVSPDGQRLVFASWGSREAIFVSGLEGENPQQLNDGQGSARAPRWSPDGKSIVFYSKRTGAWEPWWIAADGSGLRQLPRTPASSGRGGIWFPAWSPDGRRISYYAADIGSFLLDLSPTGEPDRTAPMGSPDPSLVAWDWSPDGKFIAVLRRSQADFNSGIALYEIATGQVRLVSPTGGMPVWLKDSRRIVFMDGGRFRLIDTRTSEASDLGPTPDGLHERFCVTPDNRRIYLGAVNHESDVWMVQQR